MGGINRRKHVRVKTNNLISHESIGKDGRVESRSMGKALNVSRSGILLETADPIFSEGISLLAVDLEDNLIEIKGRPIYCRKTDTGMYQTGISFIGTEQETAKFAVKLIKLFHHRKHNLIMQVAA